MSKLPVINDITSDTAKVGDIIKTRCGGDAKIIKLPEVGYPVIQFMDEDAYITSAQYQRIRNGSITNPYVRTVLGVGYIGGGKYKTRGKAAHPSLGYTRWKYILSKSYGINPTATMCDEWLNYQVFAEWHEHANMGNGSFIMIGSSKKDTQAHYSPNTTYIVPAPVALTIVMPDYNSGLHRGVTTRFSKNRGVRYQAFVVNGSGENRYVSVHDTVEEAIEVHKKLTEQFINKVAYISRDQLTQLAFEMLRTWTYDA